jgi:YHS domain-containing protein
LAVALVGAVVLAEEGKADQAEKVQDTYPLDTCIVSGGKLGSMGDPVIYEHEGREIRFCCKGCIGQFEKDPEKYLKKMDEAIIEKELPDYPIETCVVMGQKFGTGKKAPIEHVHDNHLVRFCCQQCVETFEKDPEKYLKKLDEARQKRAAEAEAHMMQEGKMEHKGQMDDEGKMEHKDQMDDEGHMEQKSEAHGSCGGH